ncbi:putative tricarboxylic transport membrane protein [Variovorax paradoxus]|uniref:tripartite tricarboxylate transporter TctB family protein n=1 Tax=Variovorax paradoxus TaxID=34073 RepID=UPI0027811211|nr:tripartite tricarboxylate transporter TctB family protein [Variovorax paradoxus]MDP9962948.1 putative tricarboxylic transport membrane protein [Variovorax paradoxus]
MSDRILGVACMALAIAMAVAAQSYVAEISYEPVGPRAFPMLLAVLLALGGLWLAFKPSRDAARYAQVPLKLVGVALATVFAYAFAFEAMGFPLATALMAVPVGMAFNGKPLKSLAAGVVLGVGCYFLFDRLLDVVLPTGLLAPLLRGL